MSLNERLRGVNINNYNYNDEMREEQLAREIGRKFTELGFGTVQAEEYEKSKKNFKKIEKWEKFSVLFSADCGRSFTRHYPLRFMQFLLSQNELAIFFLSD